MQLGTEVVVCHLDLCRYVSEIRYYSLVKQHADETSTWMNQEYLRANAQYYGSYVLWERL